MSSMFGVGFKATRCKTLLRLAMARVKLLRNKRDIQVKQMRKDIAALLSSGQEPSARIRVEHIAREQNILAAYDIIELFCELVIVRLPIIESQKACPMDLKEAIASLIFASPRCADLPELIQIRTLFTSKYGKEFVAAAAELRPECGVNRRIIEKLSVRAPSGQMKLKLLTEIAAEHNVAWDPADTEAELMRQPEDLLDGPKKFFGASQTPMLDHQPSPPKPEQRAPPAPAAAPAPAPPTPQPSGQPIIMKPLYSSEEDDDIDGPPSGEKKQFIPFVGPHPSKGVPAGEGSARGGSAVSGRGDPRNQARNDGQMDNKPHGSYDNVAAAAKAAAESADRAVAAARAAAELAKTHPSRREPLSRSPGEPPSRTPRKEVEPESSEEESEEEDEEEEVVVERRNSSGKRTESVRQGQNVASSKTDESERYQENPVTFDRSNSDDFGRRDDIFGRSNSDDYNESLFTRTQVEEEPTNIFFKTNYSEEKVPSPVRKYDTKQDSFWRSGDQDWRQAANFGSEKKSDSGGFFKTPADESSFRGRSDLFKGSQRDDPFSSRTTEKDVHTSTPKLFSSSDSAKNLFTRSASEEKDLRSSYDSKQEYETPKFDDFDAEEPPHNKPAIFSSDVPSSRDIDYEQSEEHQYNNPGNSSKEFSLRMDEDYRKSNFDSPKSNSSSREFRVPRSYSDDYYPEKQRSDSYTYDSPQNDSQGLARGASDPVSSYYEGADQNDSQNESSPLPKSRRTRRTSKGRDSLDGSGGLPPSGRPSRYSSADQTEAASFPDYQIPSESSNPSAQSYDGSPNFPPKTSLNFYNSMSKGSAPPDRAAPSVPSAYDSPDLFRESSPSVRGGLERRNSPSATSQSGRASPSLERKDSPSAPSVHPKLPDYDDLTARFEALKGKARRQ